MRKKTDTLAIQEGDFAYTVNDNTGRATILKYMGKGGNLSIPENIGGHQVEAIGDSAFLACVSLKSLKIPNGVSSIGSRAFMGCSAVREVAIPESVIRVSELAFASCGSLNSIIIPYGVQKIEKGTLVSCKSLKSVIIPSSVKTIGMGAFWECASLTSLVIPDSVTLIQERAFDGCRHLTSLILGENVKSIEKYAFSACNHLIELKLPRNLTSFDTDAVAGCNALESLTVDEKNPVFASINGILYNKSITELIKCPTSLKGDLVLPDSVINSDAGFSSCIALTSVKFGSAIKAMDKVSFLACKSLKSLILGNNVNKIRFEEFYNCPALVSITFLGLKSPAIVPPPERHYGCCSLNEERFVLKLENVLGHAYASSNFPPPGSYFGELLMGEYIAEDD